MSRSRSTTCPTEPASGLSERDEARLEALFHELARSGAKSLGYPCNQAFDYRPLYRFLGLVSNNVGDPFAGSHFQMNTHAIEREVVGDFARLTEISPEESWGYVTSGGTEGNMYGLYLARELFPEAIVYFSEHTHYSVSKILRLQQMRNIMIRSTPDGEIDYEDLEESIRIHRDVPPIIFVNAGTTMTGAIDKVDLIRAILRRLCVQNSYLHVDAALSGMILPFVENPPAWNFAAGIDSLSISGHKMIGSPLPCGVVLARKSHVNRISRSVEYVGTLDTTISGSRNAFTPLILWYALRVRDAYEFRQIVRHALGTAEYAVRRLRAVGLDAWRHEHSITVVLPHPPKDIVERWNLAPQDEICHLITVPHVTREQIDAFVDDLANSTGGRPNPTPGCETRS